MQPLEDDKCEVRCCRWQYLSHQPHACWSDTMPLILCCLFAVLLCQGKDHPPYKIILFLYFMKIFFSKKYFCPWLQITGEIIILLLLPTCWFIGAEPRCWSGNWCRQYLGIFRLSNTRSQAGKFKAFVLTFRVANLSHGIMQCNILSFASSMAFLSLEHINILYFVHLSIPTYLPGSDLTR